MHTEEKGWPIPGWTPKTKKHRKQGSGLGKRYFGAKPDGSHGETKRGWGPDVRRQRAASV